MKKVIVTGTFDIIHEGHRNFFRQAKKYGNTLVVVVARDKTVKELKKAAPTNDEITRLTNIESLAEVDKAILGSSDDKLKIIVRENPDVVCLGYDQTAYTDDLKAKLAERGCHAEIVRANPYHPEKYKTQLIKKRSGLA